MQFWTKSGNKIIQKRIQALLFSIQETPFEGIGKPEALKYNLSGTWSRRINQEHRLLYTVSDTEITILALRFHY
ncbi:MAG: Txe/YoeB family addiction module toxin [Mucilaginibacter sp.]|uniref:Txe/YoeB family addiction module toxin n=1 Tax=Mucilaginibacter sp. TaxID=1882438 RepID=UPI003567CF9C